MSCGLSDMPASNLPRAINRDSVLVALRDHIGQHNGISTKALVRAITGQAEYGQTALFEAAADERTLREVIVELRCEGHHIGAHPTRGYYLCETADELNEACLFLYERAMTSLVQISKMKQVSLPDLKGQLRLPT